MARREYRVEPLQKSHDRQTFHCGSAALDRYLQHQARQDADKRVAAPFVLVSPGSVAVLGYYTLSAFSLNADELPAEMVKKLPRYERLPATLLGRLAVDLSLKGQRLGQFLLLNALHRSLQAATGIAFLAVIVDAKDDSAASFYRHMDFIPLQATPARLFLPMKVIAELFA